MPSSFLSQDPSTLTPGTFIDFEPPNPVYFSKQIKKSNSSSGHLDPAPAVLLKNCVSVIC